MPTFGGDVKIRNVLCSWPVAALALAIGLAIAVRRILLVWGWRVPFEQHHDEPGQGMIDFRDTVILPHRAIDAGVNPYDARLYTQFVPFAQEFDPYAPWWLTATYPFTLLDWDTATLAWSIFLTLCYIAAAIYLSIIIRSRGWGARVPTLTLAAVLIVLALVWRGTPLSMAPGNIGAVVALAAGLALLAPKTWVAAALLAVAWIKPQFGIPVTLILLCLPGRARIALYGTALTALLSLPTIIVTSQLAGGFGALVSSVLRTASEVGDGEYATSLDTRIDLAGKLARVAPEFGVAITLPIGLLAVVAVAILGRRFVRSGRSAVVPLLTATITLLAVPHFRYDITMLMPVVVYAVACLAPDWRTPRTTVLLGVLAVASVVYVLPGSTIHAGGEAPYTLALLAVLGAGLGWGLWARGRIGSGEITTPSVATGDAAQNH